MDRRLIGFAGEAPKRKFVQNHSAHARPHSFKPASAPKNPKTSSSFSNHLDPKVQAQRFNPVFVDAVRPRRVGQTSVNPSLQERPSRADSRNRQSVEVKAPELIDDASKQSSSRVSNFKRNSKNKDNFRVNQTQPNASAVLADKFSQKFRLFRTQYAFMAAGVLIFISGLIIAINGFRANNEVTAQTKNSSQSQYVDEGSTSNDVSEDEPPQNRRINVAPDEPKHITIPDIGVNAWVLGMDVDHSNQLKAPNNIYDAGWYKKSAKPGANGAMLIDGHVSGPTRPGIFKNIGKLSEGNIIEVERGDGQKFNYRVVETKSYPVEQTDMLAAMTSIEPGKPALNLITCSGSFDRQSRQYTERTLVFAVLAE